MRMCMIYSTFSLKTVHKKKSLATTTSNSSPRKGLNFKEHVHRARVWSYIIWWFMNYDILLETFLTFVAKNIEKPFRDKTHINKCFARRVLYSLIQQFQVRL